MIQFIFSSHLGQVEKNTKRHFFSEDIVIHKIGKFSKTCSEETPPRNISKEEPVFFNSVWYGISEPLQEDLCF